MFKIASRETEKRQREVDFALSINGMNNVEVSQKELDLFDAYIAGEITTIEAKEKLFKKRSR